MRFAIVPNTEKIKVFTKGGTITAQTNKDPRYPSIDIFVNNTLAAVVEFDGLEKKLKVHAYDKPNEDPVASYAFEDSGRQTEP